MIKQTIGYIVVLVMSFGSLLAQNSDLPSSKEIKPSIGLGVGFLNYYGDVNSVGNHTSFINQFGYEVHVARKINDFADLGFSFLTGTMIGNERSTTRNLNFKTDISSVAVYGTFNLDYWLYWSKIINPYVTLGFESFEYNNKADLVDANGSPYHFWTDGTIRNIDQNSPLANQASLMQRDYVYETDLRAANLDGFGKYPQLAIGIPIGLGVNLNVSDRLSFKINSTFHYTFTDLIDNVSKNGVGDRQGNSLNDFFAFNSVSLHYDLLSSPPSTNPEDFFFPDYFVLDVGDHDGDGVVDGLDICPFTPEGVEVDENGCPLDKDQDGVPDFRDVEPTTPGEAFVNADGKTLTDEDFYQQYLKYIDYADIPIEILYKIAGEPQKAGQYRILLGEFSGSIPESLAEKFVQEGDIIAALNKNNQTAYLTKKYAYLDNAKLRREELLEKGFPQATIVVWEGTDYMTLEEWERKSKQEMRERFKDYYENKEQLEGMYAVKLGDTDPDARTQDKAKYFEYEDAVVLDGDSGKTDYVIGPFIDKVGAKQILAEIDREKYPNAEIVTVRNGKASPVGVEVKDVAPSNPVGPDNWNKTRVKPKEKENILQKLNGNLVIDFGKANDPKTKSVIDKIKSQTEVVEVKDADGSTKIITKKPQSDSYVREAVQKFAEQGVESEVKKVQDGALVPVDVNELKKAEQIAAIKNPEKKKDGLLSKLDGAFAIDFGSANDQKTQSAKSVIEEVTEAEEVVTATGEKKLVTSEPQTEAEAKKIIKELEKKGIEAKLVEVTDGELIPVKQEQPIDSKSKDILSKLEDSFVIDFGSPKSKDILSKLEDSFVIDFGTPKSKAEKEKIESKTPVTEIKTASGETKLISQQPKTEAEAKKVIEELKAEGVEATLSKVEDGELMAVKKSPIASDKKDGLLTKLNDAFVIDFGKTSDPKTQTAKDEIQSKTPTAEVKTQSGEDKLISAKPTTKAEAKQIIKELEKKGVEAKLTQVKDGELIPVKVEGVYSSADKSKLEKAEGNFAIDFGQITTPEEKKVYDQLKNSSGTEEVTDDEGNKQIITQTASAENKAKEVIRTLKEKGIDVSAAKVENGDVIRTNSPTIDAPKDEISKGVENNKVPDVSPSNEKLSKLENNYVVKLGTVDETTPLVERGKLLNAPNTVKVKNVDGSIDVLSVQPHKKEEEAYSEKAYINANGFDDAKVAYFKDGKAEVIRKEELEGKFTLSMGSFKSNVSSEEVNKILSVPEIESFETHNPEMTTYVLGTYDSPEQAKDKIEDLIKKGLEPSIVKIEKGKIKVVDLGSVFDQATVDRLKILSDQAKLVKTDQVVFRVQLGAFRGKIDKNVFRGVNTLSFPTSGGITKYVTGSFSTYQQAYIHKLDMRKMGFEGAFVVAYKDGKRIKVTDLVNQEKFQQVKQTVSPVEKELKKVVEPEVKKEEAAAPKISYKVQIGAYKGDEMADKLAQFPDVEMEVYGQYKRYLSGDFETYAQANQHKGEIKAKGFNSAFVVAYNNGQRVAAPGEEANVISQNDLSDNNSAQEVKSEYQLSKVLIMVQVGLYRGDIPSDLREKYAELPNLTKQVTTHGVIRYMTGNFKNLSEAAAFKEELVEKGFADAFLVAYYDNERIKIQEIVEILKTAK